MTCGPLRAHDPHERLGLLLELAEGEAALRQRRQRVALRQAGVDEAEEDLAHAEDLAGPVHLAARTSVMLACTSGRSMAGFSTDPREPSVSVTTRTSTPSAA
jgi:hypothetical protein